LGTDESIRWNYLRYSISRLETGVDSGNVVLLRSGGIGKSKMINVLLYQNRWVSVNHY
jgi:hypothetical protein